MRFRGRCRVCGQGVEIPPGQSAPNRCPRHAGLPDPPEDDGSTAAAETGDGRQGPVRRLARWLL